MASRTQFPLKVAYGLTVHKSQGMTIERLVIDSSYINKPGQLGVAIGRATNLDGLQVKHFKPRHCVLQPLEIISYYTIDSMPMLLDHTCCRTYKDTIPEEDQAAYLWLDSDSSVSDECELDEADIADILLRENSPVIDMINVRESCQYDEAVTNIHQDLNAFLLNDSKSELIQSFCTVIHDRIDSVYRKSVVQGNQKDHNTFYTQLHAYQTSDQFEHECKYLLFNKESPLVEYEDHLAFRLFKYMTNYTLREKEDLIPITDPDKSKRSLDGNISKHQIGN
jgi:hypothetical protein